MMRGMWAFLFMLATSASAAPGAPSQPTVAQGQERIPQSIWRVERSDAEHLQSGLSCPGMVQGWPRAGLTIYDAYGLDVSCGYNSFRDGAVVTLYLTRGGPLEAAYGQAKRDFVQRGALSNRRLLAEGSVTLGGLAWRKAAYAGDGEMRSDIWLTELSGWLFEYRATYPAASEPAVTAQLEQLTRMTTESAGRRLALCARFPEPGRRGKAIKDASRLSSMAIMGAIMGGGTEEAAREKAEKEPGTPIVYCVEGPVAGVGYPLLAWHGVGPDGADANLDRVSLLTNGPAPSLDLSFDGVGGVLSALNGRGAKPAEELWVASLQTDSKTSIFGYFDGRPPPSLTAKLFVQILKGEAKPLSGYSTDGKAINITVPPLH
jgi:hypothetical protein